MAPSGGGSGGGQAGRGQDNRQVAASNSTLNAWVGRRQPSWLANATPVQPSPRRNPLRPPPLSVDATTSTLITLTPAPAPAPGSVLSAPASNPTSVPAAVAVAVAAATTTPASLPIAMASFQPQPQPQPHQQPHQYRQPPQPQQSSHPLPPQSIPLPQPSQPSSHQEPSHKSRRATSSSVDDPILLSPVQTDEPSPCLSLPHDSPGTRNQRLISSSNDIPTTQAHFVLDGHANDRHPSSPRSRVSVTPVNNGPGIEPRRSDIIHSQSPPITSEPSLEMAVKTTPGPSVAGLGSASVLARVSPQATTQQTVPTKRRRVAYVSNTSPLRNIIADLYLG